MSIRYINNPSSSAAAYGTCKKLGALWVVDDAANKGYQSSDDGLSWQPLPMDAVFPSSTAYATNLAYSGTRYVAVKNANIDYRGAAYSTDLVSWTTLALPSGIEAWPSCVVYGDGKFVCGPDEPYADTAVHLLTSTDGITWSVIATDLSISANLEFLTYSSGYWWVNVDGSGTYRSSDLATWTATTSSFTWAFLVATGSDLYQCDWTDIKRWDSGTSAWVSVATTSLADASAVTVLDNKLAVFDYSGNYRLLVSGSWVEQPSVGVGIYHALGTGPNIYCVGTNNTTAMLFGAADVSLGDTTAALSMIADLPLATGDIVGTRRTQIGTPATLGLLSGARTTHIGAILCVSNQITDTAGARNTKFGTLHAVFDQSSSLAGYFNTRYGTPLSVSDSISNVFSEVSSTTNTKFGAPTSSSTYTAPLTGIKATNFAPLLGGASYAITSLAPAANYGAPIGVVTTGAVGVKNTRYGTPVCNLDSQIATVGSVTRFGAISSDFVKTSTLTGTRATQFGSLATSSVFRIYPRPTTTRFGVAKTLRTPLC